MENKSYSNKLKSGFTLIELMVVIAIIGILTGVIIVDMSGSISKSKKTSAMTTASSVLPEIVTCQDDGGRINTYSAGGVICIQTTTLNALAGHSATWPNTYAKTGWTIVYSGPSASPIPSNFSFTVTHSPDPAITCRLDTNDCS